jgi:hypothetical protein
MKTELEKHQRYVDILNLLLALSPTVVTILLMLFLHYATSQIDQI